MALLVLTPAAGGVKALVRPLGHLALGAVEVRHQSMRVSADMKNCP